MLLKVSGDARQACTGHSTCSYRARNANGSPVHVAVIVDHLVSPIRPCAGGGPSNERAANHPADLPGYEACFCTNEDSGHARNNAGPLGPSYCYRLIRWACGGRVAALTDRNEQPTGTEQRRCREERECNPIVFEPSDTAPALDPPVPTASAHRFAVDLMASIPSCSQPHLTGAKSM
jgi:hypothetical protein